ncbi:MAG: hypothetical protein LBK02_05795 [Treponema sp.]|jgi:hypothetical protein|nr:hypothetical protein [Treponema sp.]
MSRRVLFFSGLFCALVIPGLIFFVRPPVLVVNDIPFVSLYGASRIKQRQIRASISLFRRVKPVIVAENAGTDIVVFAVEAADSRPHCVIFPARYADGGQRYAGQFPEIPVIILDSRPAETPAGQEAPGEDQGKLIRLRTRRLEDFYRAGLCAAIIARSGMKRSAGNSPEEGAADTGGEILVFQEKSFTPTDKIAFSTGLERQGNTTQPHFLNSPAEYAGIQDASCAVINGSALDFLDRNLKIPIILFSWYNPAMTSREILLVFDDSPWALAAEAVKRADRDEGIGDIPSDIVFPGGRIADKGLLRDLKRAARGPIP